MELTIIGASHGTGAHVLQVALNQGHHVTTVSRTPPETAAHPNLRVLTGDAGNKGLLADALRNCDAVICTIGANGRDRSGTRTRVTQALIAAMRETGVRRLVAQSSLGVGATIEMVPFITRRIIFPLFLAPAMADHAEQENLIRQSGLDWTIVRPSYLSDKASRLRLDLSEEGVPVSKVHRGDLARLLVDLAADTRSQVAGLVVAGTAG